MEFGFQFRIGVPFSVAGVAIGIFFAIFEVQGWKVPTPIAIPLLVIVSAIIAGALGLALFELVREALRFLEHRRTTASWVLEEAPGRLDYMPDGNRAMKRFTQEMAALGKDTKRLGENLARQNRRLTDPRIADKPILKQKRANTAAKAIDQSATYKVPLISKRELIY